MQTTFKTRLRHKTSAGDGQTRLRFEPDYDDGANSEWAKYTPGLAFECTIKDEIADRWDLGSPYTFTAEETSDDA
jgi:hypothetical protein